MVRNVPVDGCSHGVLVLTSESVVHDLRNLHSRPPQLVRLVLDLSTVPLRYRARRCRLGIPEIRRLDFDGFLVSCEPRSIAPWPELQALARSSGLDRLSAVADQRPWLGAPGVTAEGPRGHPESASRKLRNRPSPFLVTRLI